MKMKWFLGILKYGLVLLIAIVIYWGFLTLYRDDNWLGISALATLLLAIAAFWVIRQNYIYRKEDRKSQSLNEIRNWAREGLNLVTRIHRLPTHHANFPPVWEVIASLSYIESQRHILLKYAERLKSDNLKNVISCALGNLKNCLDSYKQSEAMNIRLDNARKCENTFVDVLNEASKILEF